MMFGRSGVIVLVMMAWLGYTAAHELFAGACPEVPARQELDMEKFAGMWYVVESFDHDEWCTTWTISKSTEKGTWTIKESKGAGFLYNTGLTNTKLTSATLTPEPGHQAKMNINWKQNMLPGGYSFTVQSTDYTNVAGIFQCQNIALGLMHRQNGMILSRTPIIKKHYVQPARVDSPGVKVEYYRPVKQYPCGRPHEEINSGAGSSDPGPLGNGGGNGESAESEEDGEHGSVSVKM